MPRTNRIAFSFTEFENLDELIADDKELVLSAREVALNAYAPYSKFRVGASVRLETGRIVSGANVENAAFPSGICAERNALSYSVSNYPGEKPVAIAVAAFAEDGLTAETVAPCGNCRQVIAEEEQRNRQKIKVILSGREKIIVIESISDLLPFQFNKENLRIILP